MAARRQKLQEREMKLLQKQMHSMYRSVHTMHYEEHKIECYVSIQKWFRGVIQDRHAYIAMVFRYAARMWKRLVHACFSIQRSWLLKRNAKKLKQKLREERQHGQLATLNVAKNVKSKA